MNRSYTYRFLLALVAFVLLISSIHPLPVFAQTTSSDAVELSFAQLGMAYPQSLPGPVSEIALRFNFPVDWQIQPGNVTLLLDISSTFSNLMPSETQQTISGLTGGDLHVSLNGQPILLKTLQENGDSTMEITFDSGLLKPVSRSGSNELLIRWDGSASCQMNLLSNITLLPSSRLLLIYDQGTPSFTLNDFPVPFIVEHALQPKSLTFLLSEDATLSEIHAALITSAGMGRLSAGKQQIKTMTLTDYLAQPAAKSPILVFAESERLEDAIRDALGLPAGLDLQAGEGSVQLFTLPTGGSGLWVSGDAAGIVKAAQVLSTGQVIAAGDGSAMRVNAVNIPPAEPASEDLSLQELGAGELVLSPTAGLTKSFDFFIPAGEEARPDASFDLVLSHSQQLDYLRSGLAINLNGYPMVSLRLNDQTSNEVLFRLILPTNLIHPGRNTLEVAANLSTRDLCSEVQESTAWLKISASSVMHLPLERATSTALSFKTFADYPDVYLSGIDLDNVMFVLSPLDAGSWPAAADLAFQLGSRLTDQNPLQLQLTAANQLDAAAVGNFNLIAVGRPLDLPLLTQPDQFPSLVFQEDNLLSEQSNLAMVTTPTGAADVGYTAIRGYPGAAHRVFLAVLGNNSTGLGYAVQTLTRPDVAQNNFAVTLGEGVQASWFDQGLARGEKLVPAAEDVPVVVDSDAALQFRIGLVSWAVPVMLGLLLVMILIIIFEFRKNARRAK